MTILTNAKPVAYVLVRDRAAAKPFYADTLGLRQTAEDPYATTYDLNGLDLRLTTVEDHTPSAHPVLGWDVPDAVATAQDLAAKGTRLVIYPGFGQDDLGIWTSPDGTSKLGWFKDPEGNVLMISQG